MSKPQVAMRTRPPAKAVRPRVLVKTFKSPEEWGKWLAQHHARADGVWLRFFKKESGVRSLTHAEALDEALCWGWIDGQARPSDARSWLQRYTPRRPRSGWSKRNREHVARLEREGRMKPSGREQVDAAKKDGRWDRAYDSPANIEVPEDFLRTLRRHKGALGFFESLNRANVYAICYRLQTARTPATRQRRFELLLKLMKDRQKLH